MKAVAVALSMAWLGAGAEPQPEDDRAQDRLAAFRRELYGCLTARADALFELADGAVRGGAGEDPGGPVAGTRAPARARGAV